jgi:hypothetical protein
MAYEFSNKDEYELLAEGDYEVVLDTAEIKRTNDGSKRYIACSFLIRSDVEQQGKGRKVFDNIWQDKENPEQFDHKKLQKLLLVQGPTGKYSFADEDEIVQFINGLNMIIHIEKRDADDYHEEGYNQVKYLSYKPSKAQPKTLGTDNGVAYAKEILGPNVNIVEDDDSLPF